jgi:alcohol dehydrogenase (cytochrome c)
VIGAGKMGYVYVMNAASGKLIWKTPVGEHNGHDNDSLNALDHNKGAIKAPLTILPGSLGGVLTNMALDGGTIYLARNDIALTYTTLTSPLPTKEASPHDGDAGAIVARQELPTATSSPIAIAGDTVLVPAGGGGPRAQQAPSGRTTAGGVSRIVNVSPAAPTTGL